MSRMNSRFLIIKGVGGIGNRFISLMEAIVYAQKTNRIIYLDWCDGMFGPTGVNIFFKYFDLKNVEFTNDKTELQNLIDSKVSIFPKGYTSDDLEKPLLKNFYACTPWLAQYPPYKVGMGLIFKHKLSYLVGLQSFQRVGDRKKYIGVVKDLYGPDNFPLGGALSKKMDEEIVVFADFRPLRKIENIFDYINLKDEFYTSYKNYATKNDFDNVIGVHIRYTDKKPKSKLQGLIKRLKTDLEIDRNYKIFLCSDNNEIIKEFREEFDDKIIFFDKYIPDVESGLGIHKWAYRNYDENKKEQLFYDCLADMWLLSMTKKLYWQGNSSFSLISKVLKNDPKSTFDWMKF